MTVGESITLEELERDPYPIYARLRDEEPVSWVPAVQLWLVTRHDDVRTVDMTPDLFTAETDPSTLNRTMGKNMLGSEGPDQERIRRITEIPFRPRDVEERTQGMIPKLAHELVDSFVDRGEVDLFTAYADPMSVQALRFMLGSGRGPLGGPAALEPGDDARPGELRGEPGQAGAGRSRPAPSWVRRSSACWTASRTNPTARCCRGCSTTRPTAT